MIHHSLGMATRLGVSTPATGTPEPDALADKAARFAGRPKGQAPGGRAQRPPGRRAERPWKPRLRGLGPLRAPPRGLIDALPATTTFARGTGLWPSTARPAAQRAGVAATRQRLARAVIRPGDRRTAGRRANQPSGAATASPMCA